MDGHGYRYFVAAGRSREVIDEFERERDNSAAIIKTFCKKHGVDNLYGSHGRVRLASFKAEPAIGWKRDRRERHLWAPDRRGKEGRAIAKELDDLRVADSSLFAKMLGTTWVTTAEEARSGFGFVLRLPSYEEISGKIVIKIPVDSEGLWFSPSDALPIKVSEYFALKEAQAGEAGTAETQGGSAYR